MSSTIDVEVHFHPSKLMNVCNWKAAERMCSKLQWQLIVANRWRDVVFRAVGLVVAILTFSIYCSQANACTVAEITKMVDDGAGNEAIEKACNKKVDDAPRCTIREVEQFARIGKDESEIEDRCGICETPICTTNFGSCIITQGYGRFIAGGACTCPSPAGNIPGRSRCEN